MTDIITAITTFFTAVFTDFVPTVVETIVAQPLLVLFVVAVPLSGIAVGMFKRLINTN